MTTDNDVHIRQIVTHIDELRHLIHQNILQAVRGKFPVTGRQLTANVENLHIEHTPISQHQQKLTLMAKGNATDPLYADIVITETSTGKKLGTLKKHRLMNVPYFTNRLTFIVNGSEYNIVNQLRTKSGVYKTPHPSSEYPRGRYAHSADDPRERIVRSKCRC